MPVNNDPFNKKISKLIPRLKRYAIVLTVIREDADDLLQATLERAITKQHQLQENTHMDRWTFTIMSSIWKNELRSRSTRLGNGITHKVQDLIDFSSAKKLEGTFLFHQVLKEVMVLSEDQREAILLVYVEGLKYSDAADILAIPTGTLMSRLARARVALAKKFVDNTSDSCNEQPSNYYKYKKNLSKKH